MNTISLITFLDRLSDQNFLSNYRIILFHTSTYPLLLVHNLLAMIKRSHAITSLDLMIIEETELQALLHTSFLGMSLSYWLGNIDQLHEKKQLYIRNFLSNYQGQHTLYLFSSEKFDHKNLLTITFQESCDISEYVALFNHFYPEYEHKNIVFAKKIFQKYSRISYEDASLLMNYQLLSGSMVEQLLDQWLDAIIVPEKSLFTMSSYFFSKQPALFFQLWQQSKDDYAPVFWTTFWSEQIFRAYSFIAYMQAKDFSSAKKVAFRLPFTFIQKDWKRIAQKDLIDMHQKIYMLDIAAKNSSNIIYGLEVIYSKFFN